MEVEKRKAGAGDRFASGLRDPETLEAVVRIMLEQMDPQSDRPGLEETPQRVARMLGELTHGYQETAESVVGKGLFPAEFTGEVLVEKIPFYSLCEHHLVPFFGTVSIRYRPNQKILGLSKFARIVNVYARRLQVQERMTQEILDAFQALLDPLSATVQVRARHLCQEMRGVKVRGSWTVTEVSFNAPERFSHA